ncbi:MAG: CBS domain-containing protein [Bdellovibrionaceae bacterium]|nr:CBS domain-containing protein [Pseudobdellovibrionaceae bacterium]
MISRKISDHMTQLPHTIGEGATLKKAREMMMEFSTHHLPVLSGGAVVGMLSDRDMQMIKNLSDEEHVLVREIMTDEPFMVDHSADLKDVLTEMHKRGYHSAIVKGTSHDSWGIFTASDAVKLLAQTL